MFNNYFQNGWLRKVVSSGLTATFAVSTFGNCNCKGMERRVETEESLLQEKESDNNCDTLLKAIKSVFETLPEKERNKLVREAGVSVFVLALCGVLILAIEAASVTSDEIKDKEFVNKLTKAEKELFDKSKNQLVSVLNEGIYIKKSRKKLEGLKVILRDKNLKEVVSITARPGQSVDDFAHKVTIAEFRNRQFYCFMEINYLA